MPYSDLLKVDSSSFAYILEENVTIPLQWRDGVVRANIYRPKNSDAEAVPVLVTYGPYGKDIPYKDFHTKSFADVPVEHKSIHSAWETPDPLFWTRRGFAIVRADEVGTGQSPGVMNTMSASTSQCFKDVIEWSAVQPWSSGKIGLVGISYYAGSQWRVAALKPKGLACIIPWEGMADYYRDRCRHGGILSNAFIAWWWKRQVVTNQYGLPGRAARNWGPDTIEGDLSEAELVQSRHDQMIDNIEHRYLDEEYYASKDYALSDITVPVLSVANWGGIMLHLRGNVCGYMYAGSSLKYLRFIVGRHDTPFYFEENVALQLDFLNAFLKGQDESGWSSGKPPKVSMVVRKGNPGYNNPEAEKTFPHRNELEWPIPRTVYQKYHLSASGELGVGPLPHEAQTKVSYEALGSLQNPKLVTFTSPPFERETEFTGHAVAHLTVSATRDAEQDSDSEPMDIDLFLTLRHLSATGDEIFYTGTFGDPAPITKGMLRVSLRKTNPAHPDHKEWLPRREYLSADVQLLKPGEVVSVDVEIWPTSVVLAGGDRLVLEVASGDTQGVGVSEHNEPRDRDPVLLKGYNHIHFGAGHENWLLLPNIPET